MSLEKFKFDQDLVIYCDNFKLIPIDIAYTGEMFRSISDNTVKFTSFNKPRCLDETLEFVNSAINQNSNNESLIMMILEEKPNKFIGMVGLHELKSHSPKIGIWIKDSFHGKGIGKKSAKAIITYLTEKYSFYKEVIYPVAKNNIPSRKIAENLGGVLDQNYSSKSKKYELIRYIINLRKIS